MRLLFIASVLWISNSYAQTAKEIVNRYLDTVSNGKIENWNKIKSIYSENESFYSQQNFEQKIDLLKKENSNFTKIFIVFPYNHKHELYADSAFTIPLSTFYFLENRTIILMSNMPPVINPASSSRDEFFSHHVPVHIWKLLDKSNSVELLGIKEFPLDELSCYEIKMNTKGRNYYLYINTKTLLLVYMTGNEEEDRSFLTKFYNYRKVDDFLMPMTNAAIKNGIVYFWNHTRKIEINSDIDPGIFNYKKK